MVETQPHESKIDDPEQISQTQRIREILNRRSELLDLRDAANREVRFGGLNEADALLYYRTGLEGLLYELWNVFRNLEGDEGEEYLNEKEIATFTIPPPDSLQEKVQELGPGARFPDPKAITINGLRWFIESPKVLEPSFTVRSLSPPRTITETNEYILRWQELDEGLKHALEFIDVAGIDADLTEEEQQTKIDRDLLEEVDEWRKQNVKQ